MDPIMPDPDHITPDEFDRITCGLPVLTAFGVQFAECEELLAETRLAGFRPEDIGHMAFDTLPEGEREAALDELFYTYWAAREQDRETLARHQAGGAR